MADFKVTPNVLLSSQNQLDSLQSRLSGYESEISQMCGQLNFKLAARESLRSKLNRISENVGMCAKYTGNMSAAIGNISGKYTSNENTIAGHEQGSTNIMDIVSAVTIGGVLADSGIELDIKGLFSKLLGKCGIIGKVGQEVWKNMDNGVSAWGVLKSVNNVGNAIFGMMDKPDWLKLIGLNMQETSGFIDAFKDEIGKKFPGDFSTGAKTGKTITKWAGTVADFVDNGIKYGEKAGNGEISVGEAVASTAIETGYDVLIDVGATALATAGFAAAGLTAAPAVAIGAASVAIVWGADQLVSNFTNYDSLGEAATAVTIKAGEAIVDYASTAWNGICDFFGGRKRVFSGAV